MPPTRLASVKSAKIPVPEYAVITRNAVCPIIVPSVLVSWDILEIRLSSVPRLVSYKSPLLLTTFGNAFPFLSYQLYEMSL